MIVYTSNDVTSFTEKNSESLISIAKDIQRSSMFIKIKLDHNYNHLIACDDIGSDGHSYMFLLKGHEDLRQDERVMQLFGLVNTLLDNDPETFKRHLRYIIYIIISYIPLGKLFRTCLRK
jgi:hypothetical protein